jgi:hypothetical protein
VHAIFLSDLTQTIALSVSIYSLVFAHFILSLFIGSSKITSKDIIRKTTLVDCTPMTGQIRLGESGGGGHYPPE